METAQAPYWPDFAWKCNRPFLGPMEFTLYDVEALRAESGIWLFCIPRAAAQVGGFGVVNPFNQIITEMSVKK